MVDEPDLKGSGGSPRLPAGAEPPGALIAVCGDQAAGKTVFLTCLFRTVDSVVTEGVRVSFDRKLGGAAYFAEVERRITLTGQASGNLETRLESARLLIELKRPLHPKLDRELSVDLRDFAGRHFRLFADPGAARADGEEEMTEEVFKEVEQILQRADAVVILINSGELRPSARSGVVDPFSPSVVYLIDQCHKQRVPLALLISQADRSPDVTDEYVRSLRRVSDFEAKFTSSRLLPEDAGQPFGIVRRVSCYTADEKGIPLRVDGGGIWLQEPAKILLDLLVAALPRIRDRQLARIESIESQKRTRDNAAAVARRAASAGRRRVLAGGGLALALLGGGVLGTAMYRNHLAIEGRVRVLEQAAADVGSGDLSPLAETSEREELLAAAGSGAPSKQPAAVQEAVGRLSRVISSTAEEFWQSADLTKEHVSKIEALLASAGTPVEPRGGAWSNLASSLTRRARVIRSFLQNPPSSANERMNELQRLRLLADQQGDAALVRALDSALDAGREARLAEWSQAIRSKSELAERIAVLRGFLPALAEESDTKVRLAGTALLARDLVWAILNRGENARVEAVLSELDPSLAGLRGDKLRLNLIASELASCETAPECNQIANTLHQRLELLQAEAEDRRLMIESTMLDLLQTLSTSEKRKVWDTMVEEVEASYLFNTSPEALVSGLEALPSQLNRTLRQVPQQSAFDRCLERLVRSPIYENELSFLRNRVVSQCRAVAAALDVCSRYE